MPEFSQLLTPFLYYVGIRYVSLTCSGKVQLHGVKFSCFEWSKNNFNKMQFRNQFVGSKCFQDMARLQPS